jgi:GNAT superfamily N-acetyltransferase
LAGRVDVEKFDPAGDPGAVRALFEVYLAGAPVDDPSRPPMSARVFGGLLARGWCDEPRENWLARADGQVLGGYSLELPDREDRHRAALTLLVTPGHRRAGLGTGLLRHASARARELGRQTVAGDSAEGSPGDRFARAVGARCDMTECRREQDLAAVPAGQLARLRMSAEKFADGYTLRDWAGPTPEDLLGPVAELNETMNDAPQVPGAEDQHWDSNRVRAVDQLTERRGLRRYSVVAVAKNGELAALTQVAVDEADPARGHQEMTAVTRPHRGHRLGLLTKVAMVELLATREPQLAVIDTSNGVTNTHMIAINEALGYRPVARINSWVRPTDADCARGGRGQS